MCELWPVSEIVWVAGLTAVPQIVAFDGSAVLLSMPLPPSEIVPGQ